MPANNCFQHQVYSNAKPATEYEFAKPQIVLPESEAFGRRLARVGRQLANSNVSKIFLLHGTFTGTDSLGFVREIARVFPDVGRMLGRGGKKIVDVLTGESGNFTKHYAELFENGINRETAQRIEVECFEWSSENHHLGRADGTIRLLARLFEETQGLVGSRVLLIGHSHAGNVFAMLSNLLAADRRLQDRFFEAAAWFYRYPLIRYVDVPIWTQVRAQIASLKDWPIPLDVVTLGTPIRYGWDADGYAQLLHIVNHRPTEGLPAYLASTPTTFDDLKTAKSGDYIQQLGIAGTNFLPYLLTLRNWFAERRLGKVVQRGIRKRDILQRLRMGQRVPDEGTTVLADFPDDPMSLRTRLFGHAVYTRPEYLVFHAETITRCFYDR